MESDDDQEELDHLCKDTNEDRLDDLGSVDTPFTVTLIGIDVAAIKQLVNGESVDNIGL